MKRRQCYLCFVVTFSSTVFFYCLMNFDNDDHVGPTRIINGMYSKFEIIQMTMFSTNLSILYLTGMIDDDYSKARPVTCITTFYMYCKSQYYVYKLFIEDIEKFSFPNKLTRCFTFINPADLRV